MSKTTYTTKWLSEKLADRANITKADARLFMKVLKRIIREVVAEKAVLDIRGLCKIWVKPIPERLGYPKGQSGMTGGEQTELKPATVRVYFSPAVPLLEAAKLGEKYLLLTEVEDDDF